MADNDNDRKRDKALSIASDVITSLLTGRFDKVLGSAVVKPALELLAAGAGEAHQEAQVRVWLEQVAVLMRHASAAETLRFIVEHIDEPVVHQGVTEAVRRIREDIDEAALPHLARASAAQFQDGFVDRRTRRFTSMLMDCDSELIAGIQYVLSAAAAVFEGEGDYERIEIVVQPSGNDGIPRAWAGSGKVFLDEEALEAVDTLKGHRFLLSGLATAEHGPEFTSSITRQDLDFLRLRLDDGRPHGSAALGVQLEP